MQKIKVDMSSHLLIITFFLDKNTEKFMASQYKRHRRDHCISIKCLKKHSMNISQSIYIKRVID